MSVLEIVLVAMLGSALLVLLVQTLRLRVARARIIQLESARDTRRPPGVVRSASRAVRAVAETAALVRNHGVGGFVASSIEDLTQWVSEDKSEIARITAPDGTVTIFFSDIEGSTELNERLGDRTFVKVLAQHDAVVRSAIARHHGHVVKTQGDGFMVVFREPADAVRAGLDIQERLGAQRGRLRITPVAVRIGLHRGAVVARDGDYFGRNVAMAARVAAQAQGGEILVSSDVREALLDATEFVFPDAIEVALKGLAGTHLLWQVDAVDPSLLEPAGPPEHTRPRWFRLRSR